MRRTRARALFVAAAVLVSAPRDVHACKCAAPPSAAEALSESGAVFEGRVAQITPLDLVLEVSFNVVRAWKGVSSETIQVRTRRDSAACGIVFESGESYLVYATESSAEGSAPALEALRCSRTRPIAEAEDDLVELGMGVVPVAAREPASARPALEGALPSDPGVVAPAAGGCASCTISRRRDLGHAGAALGWLGAAGAAWVIGIRVIRRSRRRRDRAA